MFASKMKTQYARSSAVGPLEVNVCKSVFFLNMSASLLILRAPVGYVALHVPCIMHDTALVQC